MGYAQALEKAWMEVSDLAKERNFSVRLLSDSYEVDLNDKAVRSLSCNIPAKEHISIIILHYLIQKLKFEGLPATTGEWLDFNQLEGAAGYYPTFKKRTIDHILRKYGSQPEALLNVAERLPAKQAGTGDIGIIIDALENVPMLITIWKADDEFGPDANILFDKNITKIFCIEDTVVLTEIVAHTI